MFGADWSNILGVHTGLATQIALRDWNDAVAAGESVALIELAESKYRALVAQDNGSESFIDFRN